MSRLWRTVVVVGLARLLPRAMHAQASQGDSARAIDPAPFVIGAVSSYLIHELGHVGMSIALGGHPTFGLDTGRPVVYSGFDASRQPHKQFLFSAAGLSIQSLVDELILDVPHRRGSAFERGVLAGGLVTTAFYLTIGRTGSVSDVSFMAATHGMTKTQSTLLFGAIGGTHIWRIVHRPEYIDFFAWPTGRGATFSA